MSNHPIGLDGVADASDLTCDRENGAVPVVRGFRITDRDVRLLQFIAAHRFVLACQARAFMGCDRAVAYRRLAGLEAVGLLVHERIFHAQPGIYRVTPGALRLIGSELPRPRIDLRTYRHDVGAVWVWLAAHAWRYGCCHEVWSERELRSQYMRSADPDQDRFALPVAGHDRHGRRRIHHPDVLVLDDEGVGTAVELELSVKSRSRLESIVLAYGYTPAIARVVYLTDSRRVQTILESLIAGFGLDGRIMVQYLEQRDDGPQWWLWPSLSATGGGS